jgi:serine/threonine-protein kinase
MLPFDAARWQVLSALLAEVLPLPDPQREARLQLVANEDPDLAKQLRVLLQADRDAQRDGFLQGHADLGAHGAGLKAGDLVGAWTLREVVGEGGMGEVWRAQRRDGRYEGDAAIKFLKQGRHGPVMQQRFQREGALLARLRHPGIAQLLDAGLTEHGQPYLVLEWVDGQRIDRWCDAAALGLPARIRLFLQVLAAVSAAHSQLVIHRDLKPSNILVDGQGQIKLLDFGIAKLLDEDQAPELTREGTMAMTPEFAAPEQFGGQALGVTTDVYALGVVLYVLLTGQHPSGLQGETNPLAYLRAATEGPTRRASQVVRSPDQARLLAGDLDNILACAMAFAPEQRYASVQALMDDLQRHLAHLPVVARRASWPERARLFVRRNRLSSALAGLAALAVVVGLAGTMAMAWRARASAELAQAERQRANLQAQAALAQRDVALQEMSKAQQLSSLFRFMALALPDGRSLSKPELLERTARHIDERGGLAPEHRALLLAALAEHLMTFDHRDQAAQMLQRASAYAAASPDLGIRAFVACNLANTQMVRGDYLLAIETVRLALRTVGDDAKYASSRINCLQVAEWVYREAGDTQASVAHIEQALSQVGKLPVPDNDALIDTHGHAAMAYQMAGRIAESVRHYEATFKLLDAAQLTSTAVNDVMSSNMGSLWFYVGRPLDGLALTRRARQVRNVGDPDAPDAATSSDFDDTAWRQLGRHAQALAWSDRLIASVDQSGHFPAGNLARMSRVATLREMGRLDEATALIAETRQRLTTLPPGNHHFGQLLAEEGLIAARRGQTVLASQRLNQGIEQLRSSTNAALFLPPTLLRRAEFQLAQQQLEGAQQDAQEAQRLLLASLGPDMRSLHHGDALMVLGQVATQRGQPAEARTHFEAAAAQYADALGPQNPKTLAAVKLARR